MPADFKYDVFLSHHHADKPQVRRLVPVSQLSTFNSQPSARDCALPDTLRRYKVVDFREESEAAFGEACEAKQRHHRMFARIHASLYESRTLSTLRDTLLPKLPTGEISTPEPL